MADRPLKRFTAQSSQNTTPVYCLGRPSGLVQPPLTPARRLAGRRIVWQDVDLMPLQNRVDPFGNFIRSAARGTMMGNRGGALHNGDREIVRGHKSRRWITCLLEFRGRHRIVMSPNRYTELFFLDEAVAFAAGHRPCAECRRERYNAFKGAWQLAHQLDKPPFADEMDVELHAARIEKRKKVTYEAALRSLPDGCFVQIEGDACLVLAMRCCSGRRKAMRGGTRGPRTQS